MAAARGAMNVKALLVHFSILVALCAGFVLAARMMGRQGAYLAQGYMLTPAIAALITRLFFHPRGFRDAHLRFGRPRDYVGF